MANKLLDALKSIAARGPRPNRRANAAPTEDDALRQIEDHAAAIARGAGAILQSHFNKALDVRYKDDKQSDPVTNADLETQRYLQSAIAERFPTHGILGEEDDAERRERMDAQPSPDFVWALDPLDGTRNFLSGLPIYASSVGVLHKGVPVAAAVFLPWPTASGGITLHARKGGGARADGEPIAVQAPADPSAAAPAGNRLTTLPGGFGAMFGVRKPLRGKVGELRMTGSIAYELAMVAKGVTQYTLTTAPFIWDAAGGALLVVEAGGAALQGRRRGGLAARTEWQPLTSFVPSWRSGKTTMRELRAWRAPLLLGNPDVARYVAANLSSRSPVVHAAKRAARKLRR